ncbi:MAG: DUF4384 domain-containing protein [Candidatus Sumerlaeota bacterium]|nr:DUF4384 domain-containing protein [Candidatus Sumerlaeota bacterium]
MNIRVVVATCAFMALAIVVSAVGVDKKAAPPGDAATAPALRKATASGIAPLPLPETRGIEPIPPPPHNDFRASVWTTRNSYSIGERIRVYFRVTRSAHVFIFSEDPSGETRQFYPNYYDRSNHIEGGSTYYIPDDNYELKVTGPRGINRITIVAVRDKYPFFNQWQGYSSGDPFPRASGGATALLQRVKTAGPGPQQLQGIEVRGIEPGPKDGQYAEGSATFRVEGGDGPRRHPYNSGGIEINTRPQGASIYLDGKYMGKTPAVINDIEARVYQVRLSRKGYPDYEHEVTIRPGETRNYTVKLNS